MSCYRKGDIVTIKCVLEYDANKGDEIHVKPVGYFKSIMLPDSSAVVVEQSIEAGDEVIWDGRDPADFGLVMAVANGHAWIDLGGGDYCTRTLGSIRRCEIEEKIDA